MAFSRRHALSTLPAALDSVRDSSQAAHRIRPDVTLAHGKGVGYTLADLAEQEFNFEAEFSLLDIGATSSLLRGGSVRPTVMAFNPAAGVEAVSLQWDDDSGVERAFEEARRYVRDLNPIAYTVVAHISCNNGALAYHLPGTGAAPVVNDFLALALYARDGNTRAAAYPVRRAQGKVSLGMPTITDSETTEWWPLGDLWNNPFCAGDTVRFRPKDRAVDPSSSLWTAVVELTRLRIQDDQPNADEYMSFLDDLRNGIFVVAGRPESAPERVLLRPRTHFNPLGTISVKASRLLMSESVAPDVEKVAAS